MRNDDYGLALVIPDKLTAWGAADVAPFHGFTIFLPGSANSDECIVFEIHLRVELGQDAEKETRVVDRRHVAPVGNVRGWRAERTGARDSTAYKNVVIQFSVRHGADIFDGSVWLVSTMHGFKKNKAILNSFLSRTHFDDINRDR